MNGENLATEGTEGAEEISHGDTGTRGGGGLSQSRRAAEGAMEQVGPVVNVWSLLDDAQAYQRSLEQELEEVRGLVDALQSQINNMLSHWEQWKQQCGSLWLWAFPGVTAHPIWAAVCDCFEKTQTAIGDTRGKGNGPVVADGEPCFRVPVTLWEKTLGQAGAAELLRLERAELVEALEMEAEKAGLLGRQLEEARAHGAQLQAQLNALVRASEEEACKAAAPQGRDLEPIIIEVPGITGHSPHTLNMARARRGIPPLPSIDSEVLVTPEEIAKTKEKWRAAHSAALPEKVVQEEDSESGNGEGGKGHEGLYGPARHLDGLPPLPAVSDGDVERRAALELVLMAVGSEVGAAMGKHARFNSAHEGYAVILEELDELKAEVWKKREERDKARLQDEAVQVAAMAVRFVLDVI